VSTDAQRFEFFADAEQSVDAMLKIDEQGVFHFFAMTVLFLFVNIQY
jgi:hypothetical protein